MKTKVIGITGRAKNRSIAGCGKTTVALEIQRITGAVIYGLADPIYEMIKVGLGIDGRSDEWQCRDKKNAPIEWLSTHEEFGICKQPSLRTLLETLGTEWGRDIVCRDVWTRLATRFISQQKKDQLVLIPDIRFNDESEWLESIGGVLVHVIRPDYEPMDATVSHKSNQVLPIRECDFVINNTGTICDLFIEVKNLLSRIDTLK